MTADKQHLTNHAGRIVSSASGLSRCLIAELRINDAFVYSALTIREIVLLVPSRSELLVSMSDQNAFNILNSRNLYKHGWH